MENQNWNQIKTRTSGGKVSIDGLVEETVIESFKAPGRGATFSIRNPRETEEDIIAGEAAILVSFDGSLTEPELAELKDAARLGGRIRIRGEYVPGHRVGEQYLGHVRAEQLEYLK